MSWFVLAVLFAMLLLIVGGAVAFCMSRSRSYQEYVKNRDDVKGHRIKL